MKIIEGCRELPATKAKRSEEGCLRKIRKNFLVDWMHEVLSGLRRGKRKPK